MTYLRDALLIILGLLLGALAMGVGGYYVLKGPLGRPIIRDNFVERGDITPPPAQATTTALLSNLEQAPPTILVPKAFASQRYYKALNAVFQDVVSVDKNNRELAPVLGRLNQYTLSCTFKGFYEDMAKARLLVAEIASSSTHFSADVAELDSANASTPDSVTKSLTLALTAQGGGMRAALGQYSAVLQKLLMGDIPTTEDAKTLAASLQALSDSSKSFGAALEALLRHFVEAAPKPQTTP